MRGVLTALLPGLLALGSMAGAEEKSTITMAVRVDARPFAWRDRASGSYLGFLVDLCTDAVTRAGYPFVQIPVTAKDRLEFLSGARRDFDLLCDPTTINLDRLDVFRELEPAGFLTFSPIVFVANGSYLINTKERSGEIPPVDKPSECFTTPPVSPATPPADGGEAGSGAATKEPEPTYLAAGYVTGATIGPILLAAIREGRLKLETNQFICPVEQDNHTDAAAAFCRADLHYYFGDAGIIAANVLAYVAEEGVGSCDFDHTLPSLSYEPYALVISAKHPEFRDDFVRALYELFHDGTAEDRFHGHFEGREMSPFLETLFRINRIPAGSRPAPPENGGP